ncbi:MAG: hypothetical protein BGP06_05610 [Rhizobiales bacterium 65-9]|nr:hypothetical protein [Hyphomicrobiales bacterium]OJY35348.1 MAG: hypothetical protein BGP06_05610 [Rhizobiales bacterium 65-9]
MTTEPLEPWFETVGRGYKPLLKPIHPEGKRVLRILVFGMAASLLAPLLLALVDPPIWFAITLVVATLFLSFVVTPVWFLLKTRNRIRIVG